MLYRGIYIGNVIFYYSKVVSKSKIGCEILRFIIEVAVRLCEGRRCKTAGANMFAFVRLWSPMAAFYRIGPPLEIASVGG